MKACTFFGHRDCPDTIYPRLRNCIEDLIVHHEVQCFYIGHQGRFDALALHALRELKKLYPELRYYVVLAYFTEQKNALSAGGNDLSGGIGNGPLPIGDCATQ